MRDLEDKVKKWKENVEEEQNKFLQLKEDTSRYINTYNNGKYTDKVREYYITLLSVGVSTSKVDATIRTVLKLAEREAGRLPSATLVKNMAVEAGILSKIQVGKVIRSSIHFILMGQRSLVRAYEISTVDGSYSLALCEMKSGCTTDSLDTLDNILEDIEEAYQSVGINDTKVSIVTSIKKHHVGPSAIQRKRNSIHYWKIIKKRI